MSEAQRGRRLAIGIAALVALVSAPAASAATVERLEFWRAYDRGGVRQSLGVDGSGPRWVDAFDSGPTVYPDPFSGSTSVVSASPDGRGSVSFWGGRYTNGGMDITYAGRGIYSLGFDDAGIPSRTDFAWSPDSSRIVAAIAWESPGEPAVVAVTVIDTADGTRHAAPAVYLSPLAWAPDGSRLVGVRAGDPAAHLDILTSAGAAAGSVDLPAGSPASTLAWYPSGDHVVVGLTATGGERLVRVRVADGQATELSPSASTWTFGPGAARLALVEGGELVSVAATGGDRQTIVGGAAGPLAWSPASDLIAYVRADNGIGLVQADGTGARRLTARAGDAPIRFVAASEPAADSTPPRAVVGGRVGRRQLFGWFTDAAGSGGLAGVRVRIVRERAGACAVWTGSGYRATPCGSAGRGVRGTLAAGGNGPVWGLPVRFTPGRYTVQAVATDRAGNVDPDAPIVRFRIRA